MPVPKRTVRGLSDIRTYSGRTAQTFHPYKAYMRITCLEMEKARRGEEKYSAIHRVNIIEDRLKDIDVETEALLRSIGVIDDERSHINTKCENERICSSQNTGRFKIQY